MKTTNYGPGCTTKAAISSTLDKLSKIKRICPSLAQSAIMAAELLIEIQQKKIEMMERELTAYRGENHV